MISRLDYSDPEFDLALTALLSLPEDDNSEIRAVVRNIIGAVRKEGDAALLALTRQHDRVAAESVQDLEVSAGMMAAALERVDPLVVDALNTSIQRVRTYHEKQKAALGGNGEWGFLDDSGNQLGQVTRAMQRVGVYAPGGKAAYPSTIIMTVIPARVAGVAEIILTVPTPDDELNDVLLAAAHLCGVTRMFRVGGAQAIAALAYGTETIPAVDKIVGPGNVYVATAKAEVFGKVGIDMIAGPSEVVIVADGAANAEWLAMDLFAQAEHDELAQSILVSDNQPLLDDVSAHIAKLLPGMARRKIIESSLLHRGGLIKVSSVAEALDVVNRIAPEHLELAVQNPDAYLPGIAHAGAIFVGESTAEVVGDYTAGPSHVLPTSGTARFASPLGVYDFQVRSSLVQCSRQGAVELSRAAAILATEEGLEAHSRSASYRVQG